MRPTAAFVPPPVSGEGEGQVEGEDSVILTNPPPTPTGSSGTLTSPMALAICHPCRRLGPCVGDTGASEGSLVEAGAWGGGLRGYWALLWESGNGCLPKHELSLRAEGLAKGRAWTDAPTSRPVEIGEGRGAVSVPRAVTHRKRQEQGGHWRGTVFPGGGREGAQRWS